MKPIRIDFDYSRLLKLLNLAEFGESERDNCLQEWDDAGLDVKARGEILRGLEDKAKARGEDE